MADIVYHTVRSKYGEESYYELTYWHSFERKWLNDPKISDLQLKHWHKRGGEYRTVRLKRLHHSECFKYGVNISDFLLACKFIYRNLRYQWVYDLEDAINRHDEATALSIVNRLNAKQKSQMSDLAKFLYG